MERDEPKPITIASILKTPNEGESFDRWPHHVTLAPPFTLPDSSSLEQIKHAMYRLTDKTASVPVIGGNEALLGDEQPVRVRLIKDAWAVEALHELVMRAVEENGGIPTSPSQYVHEEFLPHVTYKEDKGWLRKDQKLMLPGIDIVERDPNRNNLKTVLAHYAFTGWTRLD